MSGRDLSRRCYETLVRPLLTDRPHAAALLGEGSQVLGFDDLVSTDHDFGPGLQVFVRDETAAEDVREALRDLPPSFEGYPVSAVGGGPTRIEVTTAATFFADRLGVDPLRPLTLRDWLLSPTQVLASLVDGLVFADDDDLLTTRRTELAWYPDDVWRYVLAAGWMRVAQEQAFVGRAGGRGDDLGSRIVAARLVRDQIRLAFLIERRWAPYSKWLGTAFAWLPLARAVGPALDTALAAANWRDRERAVVAASSALLAATNALGLASPVDAAPHAFFGRDVVVVEAEAAARSLVAAATDPAVRALVARLGHRVDGAVRLPGAIDQAVDSTDVLADHVRCRSAAALLGLDGVDPPSLVG